ncbi:hypothetical protein BD324DRAFT_651682 [Kockovaella imperatae]|uniref:SH3 domain-containing protein n=1 Tax=Kockovaella imperatae TaxID=4999 RepID=A0A1Y1UEJ6_9TREE|nr:hypothetical protein BD324DRAFT_651682 [Kockovaella imperatae]ORX36442.1 hypothetical protein BD324DRAFT_651682 [Kockovaella imperatae]
MLNDFSTGHVLSHPLFLVTFALAFPAWIIAFAGQIAAEAQFDSSIRGNSEPVCKYLWYSIWIQLAVTIHLFLAICTDQLAIHRFQIAVFAAIAEVFSIYGANFLFDSAGSLISVGVGWLLIAIVDLIWILYLTSEEGTLFHNLLSFGGRGGASVGPRHSVRTPKGVANYEADSGLGAGVASSGNGNITGQNGGAYASVPAANTAIPYGSAGPEHGAPQFGQVGDLSGQPTDTVQHPTVQRAKAMYAYNANPDDPNEVSFAKGDLLEVIDNTGKWFQVRTPSGQTGIAPSNYLTML